MGSFKGWILNITPLKNSTVICFSNWNSDRNSSKNSTVIRFSDGNSCFFSDVVKILGYLDPEQKNEAQNLCLRCNLRQCPNLTCEKLSYECLFASRFCPNLNWETWKKKRNRRWEQEIKCHKFRGQSGFLFSKKKENSNGFLFKVMKCKIK